MLYLLFIVTIIIGILEGIPLARKKMHKELGVVILLLVFINVVGILKALELPTPIEIINNIFSPVGKSIFKER